MQPKYLPNISDVSAMTTAFFELKTLPRRHYTSHSKSS